MSLLKKLNILKAGWTPGWSETEPASFTWSTHSANCQSASIPTPPQHHAFPRPARCLGHLSLWIPVYTPVGASPCWNKSFLGFFANVLSFSWTLRKNHQSLQDRHRQAAFQWPSNKSKCQRMLTLYPLHKKGYLRLDALAWFLMVSFLLLPTFLLTGDLASRLPSVPSIIHSC